MLTQEYPFSAFRKRRLTSQILNDEPNSIRDHNQDVPAKLESFIIGDCLCKDAKCRPTLEEAGEFLKDYGGGRVRAKSVPDS